MSSASLEAAIDSGAVVSPAAASSAAAPAAAPAAVSKGLLKKLRKQLASGRGPNSKTLSLIDSSAEAAALVTEAVCSVDLDARAARHGVTVAQVRESVLRLCAPRHRLRQPAPFLVLGNAKLIRVVVLLLLSGEGDAHVDAAAGAAGGGSDARVCATHVWHKRGRQWSNV
jgi:hypothetical protein